MQTILHVGGTLDGNLVDHESLPPVYIHHIDSIEVEPSGAGVASTHNLLLERYRLSEIDGRQVYKYIDRKD